MHSLKNVLTYAITDITTWGADMPLMVGHVRTRAYLYIFKLTVFHGGNCSFFTVTMDLLLLIMIAKYKHPKFLTLVVL